MSTSPDPADNRPQDAIVGLLSGWLAGHVDDAELHTALESAGTAELDGEEADAVAELLRDLARGATRAELQVSVRETLELLAF